MNRKFLIFFTLLLLPLVANADDYGFLLNKITLQLHSKSWVTSQTALVDVSVNAMVQAQGIDKVQAGVLERLKKLANKSEWHIVSLDRGEEKSGLESIQIHAQARLEQNVLSDLRDKAKMVSTPGETYKIENIEFKPSDQDLRQAEKMLRDDIYNQVKVEIDTLNKLYPDQKYYLHSIDFMNAPPEPMPMRAMYMKADMVSAGAPPSPLDVGNKRELTAMVVIGSLADTRKGLPPNL